jgi:CRP-like cAMP-binding protein
VPNTIDSLLSTAVPWLSGDCAAALERHFVRRECRKGAVLLRQGEVFSEVLVVEAGVLRLFFTQRDGREFNKNFFPAGRVILPATGQMASRASLFSIASLEPAAVWSAPMPRFKQALSDHGAWHTVQRKLLAGMVNEKLQREHDLLALSGSERYSKFCTEHPVLAQRISVGHLASYLGLTNVSLSRIRSAGAAKAAGVLPQRTQ